MSRCRRESVAGSGVSMKTLMLAAAILAATPAYGPARAQDNGPALKGMNADPCYWYPTAYADFACHFQTREECRQFIDHIRANGGLEDHSLTPVSRRCQKSDDWQGPYRGLFIQNY